MTVWATRLVSKGRGQSPAALHDAKSAALLSGNEPARNHPHVKSKEFQLITNREH